MNSVTNTIRSRNATAIGFSLAVLLALSLSGAAQAQDIQLATIRVLPTKEGVANDYEIQIQGKNELGVDYKFKVKVPKRSDDPILLMKEGITFTIKTKVAEEGRRATMDVTIIDARDVNVAKPYVAARFKGEAGLTWIIQLVKKPPEDEKRAGKALSGSGCLIDITPQYLCPDYDFGGRDPCGQMPPCCSGEDGGLDGCLAFTCDSEGSALAVTSCSCPGIQ
jgi:hypothetical protein